MSIKLNKPVSILENEYPDYDQYSIPSLQSRWADPEDARPLDLIVLSV